MLLEVLLACLLVARSAAAAAPSIKTVNGTLHFIVPYGTPAAVVFADANGVEAAPIPVALASDLAALRTNFTAQLSALEARFTTMLQSTQNSLLSELATKVSTQNLSTIDNEVVAVVNNMVAGAPSNSLSAQLSSLSTQLGTKLTSSATCQCFDPRTLQAVNSSLSAFQAQATTYFVDVRNLTTIDSEIASVARGVVGPQTAALNSTLNVLSAYCVDTRNLAVIDSEVSSVIVRQVAPQTSALNASLSAFQQLVGAYYVDTRNLSVIDGEISRLIPFGSISAIGGSVQAVNTSLSALQQTLAAYYVDTRNLSTIDGEVSAVIARVVTPQTTALNASLTAFQQQAAANYVDKRNLSSIDGEIASVVNGMVAPGASNALATVLATKLNSTDVLTLVTQSLRCLQNPGAVAFGDSSVCVGTFSGSSCNPSCQLGYTAVGNFSCTAGTWFGNSTCTANSCRPNLAVPANGTVTSATGVTGSVSTFSCNPGFTLLGASSTTCLPTGNWSSTGQSCRANGQTPEGAVGMCTDAMVNVTGLYYIRIALSTGGSSTIQVFCRVDPDGSKWLMFQRRTDTTLFYLTWTSYVTGFGTVSTNNITGTSFWLGLETLYQITRTGAWKLRVDLLDQVSGQTAYEQYSPFAIGSSGTFYALTVANPTGTAGDALTGHNGAPFSTYDADHDTSSGNCAQSYRGAWWYTACHSANLNGNYYPGGCYTNYADGVDWCGATGAQCWPGITTSCNTFGDNQPCHHNSLKSWMLLAPGP